MVKPKGTPKSSGIANPKRGKSKQKSVARLNKRRKELINVPRRMEAPTVKIVKQVAETRVPESLLREARKYVKNMLLADKPMQMPRLVPTPTTPCNNFGRQPVKLYQNPDMFKGQTRQLILRCTTNLLNPVERFIVSNESAEPTDQPQQTFNRNFVAESNKHYYFDGTFNLPNGRHVLTSPFVASGALHWSSSTKQFKSGGKYYPCSVVFGSATNGLGTMYNPDSALMSATFKIEVLKTEETEATVLGSVTTTDNYTSKANTVIGGSSSWVCGPTGGQSWAQAVAYLNNLYNTSGANGFAISFQITNSSTIGNVPSGMEITLYPANFTFEGYGYWQPFAWVTPSVIETSVKEILESDQYAYNAMSVLLENQTPEAFEGGSIIVAQVPADDQWRVPNTPDALRRYLMDMNVRSVYEGNASKGGHWAMKFQTLDQLHWKNEHPRETQVDDATSYPYGYFFVDPAFISGSEGASECTFMLWTNLAYELITTTQTRPLVDPIYDRFGLVAAFIAALSEFNTCSCNPDHFTKVKNAVTHVMKDPRVRSVLASMAKVGVTTLLSVL